MILDKFKLDRKIALVTGCKRGIGKAMATGLAEAGADIICVSASLELEGSEVEKEILNLGRKFKAYQCDFSERRKLHEFIKIVKSENENIDLLINNAGTILRKPVREHPDEYWDKVIEVSLSSQFILVSIMFHIYLCNIMLYNYFVQFIFSSEYYRVGINFV
ncbi:MAG TPA: SDR family NAD(P)-dependent oxidoreductase [Ignavibacteria bacterium]|nr:SDR family NAD(P)-dependent oxidoreductase [Ignavibacteria bacterium]